MCLKCEWKNDNPHSLTFDEFWNEIIDNPTRSLQYNQLLYFICIRKVLPLATACCERGFSTMKAIKTDERSRMTTDQLSSRMMAYLNGPALSDKPAVHKLALSAFKIWDGMKKRRPAKSHRGPRRKKKRDERDLGAVLSRMYDLSDDEELPAAEEEPADEDVADNEQADFCEHDFVAPPGVFFVVVWFLRRAFPGLGFRVHCVAEACLVCYIMCWLQYTVCSAVIIRCI